MVALGMRIKLTDEDIEIFEWEESSDPDRYELNFMCNSLQEAEQLKKQILEDSDKAEKWDKLIESQTFDFEPIDDVEEITRQLINNEIRTTHKLYEENRKLREELGREE